MRSIASIDNVSGKAWSLVMPPIGLRMHLAPPSIVYKSLRDGDSVAGLLPVVRLRELSHRYAPLGAYGIACTGAVQSVALFSREPTADLLRANKPVHLTAKSETSKQLLFVLARISYGCALMETHAPETAHANLLIGDEAILAANNLAPGSYRYDLCEGWREMTGLPFVFARWVVRRDMPQTERTALEEWLESCAQASETRDGIATLARRSPVPFETIDPSDYYTAIRCRLNVNDLQGLDMFLNLQSELGLCNRIA